jgi:hypothetical protein
MCYVYFIVAIHRGIISQIKAIGKQVVLIFNVGYSASNGVE